MQKVALIPSYQPEDKLIDLVVELDFNGFNIVVVDDGSGPDYHSIFSRTEKYATLISYSTNQGKGYALKKGLQYIGAHSENAVVVTMDGDGQHTVADADKLANAVMASQAEQYDPLIIGSRKLPSDAPIKSRLGNGITRFVYRTLTGVNVYDTQSGLRAFSDKWIKDMLAISGDRYEYEMNVLLYVAKHKLPVKELPIEVIYFDKDNSVSHFDAVSDSAKIYKEIGKFAASSFPRLLTRHHMIIKDNNRKKGDEEDAQTMQEHIPGHLHDGCHSI